MQDLSFGVHFYVVLDATMQCAVLLGRDFVVNNILVVTLRGKTVLFSQPTNEVADTSDNQYILLIDTCLKTPISQLK